MKKMMKKTVVFWCIAVVAVAFLLPARASARPALKVSGATATYVMKQGTHKQLTANTYVTWKSSRPKTVYCSAHGWIKAKKKGTATITVRTKYAPRQKSRIKVIVGTRVKKIKLGGTSAMSKGKTKTVKASISPKKASYQAVKWTSSNPAIATVTSGGKVKSKKGGTVTIKAKAKDGSGVIAKKKIKVYALKAMDTEFVAHRGCSDAAPENTEAAFRLAGRSGFYGVECDVWPTKQDRDGSFRFVVSHDNSLKRMCGDSHNITDMTETELEQAKENGLKVIHGNGIASYGAQEILYLEDYLSICKEAGVMPVIELKHSSDVETGGKEEAIALCRVVHHAGLLDRCQMISFSSSRLQDVQQEAKNSYYAYPETILLENRAGEVMNAIQTAKNNHFTGIRLQKSILNQQVVSAAREKGLHIGAYTATTSKVAYDLQMKYDMNDITANGVIFD